MAQPAHEAEFFGSPQRDGTPQRRLFRKLQRVRVIQALGSEKHIFRHFEGASFGVQRAQRRTNRLEAYLMSTVLFFTNVNNLVIIAAGSYFIIQGAMKVADLVVFLMYLMLFIRPIMQLTMLTEQYQRSMAGFSPLCGPDGSKGRCRRPSRRRRSQGD